MNESGYGYENMVADKKIDIKRLSNSLQTMYGKQSVFGKKKPHK